MQLFVQPAYYDDNHWHGLSFTVKPWASRGIPTMYERSCQACIWSQWLPVTSSLPCYAILRLTIVQKVSFSVCCQCIQLELTSLSLTFTPTLYSLAVLFYARSHGLAEGCYYFHVVSCPIVTWPTDWVGSGYERTCVLPKVNLPQNRHEKMQPTWNFARKLKPVLFDFQPRTTRRTVKLIFALEDWALWDQHWTKF